MNGINEKCHQKKLKARSKNNNIVATNPAAIAQYFDLQME
jgi:hypothetical protein